jgi:hypothetical protein
MLLPLTVGNAELATVPAASGIYTAWLSGEEQCLYVGKARVLVDRIRSHFSGQRGSDQFCLYVYDRFVFGTRPDGLSSAEVNRLTAKWIQEHVTFRWVAVAAEELAALESALRRLWQPILNPLSESSKPASPRTSRGDSE